MTSLEPTDFSSWGFMATRDAPHMAGALSQVQVGNQGRTSVPCPPMTGELLQVLPEGKPPVKVQT